MTSENANLDLFQTATAPTYVPVPYIPKQQQLQTMMKLTALLLAVIATVVAG